MSQISLDFKIENTKDGFPIIKINKSRKDIYIGSKYNMKKAIDDFIDSIIENIKKDNTVVIYGFSTGDHVKALAEKIENKIIVFEPNKNMKNYIEDMSWVKENDQLQVICGEIEEFKAYIEDNFSIFNINNMKLVYFSNYKKIYLKEANEFQETLNNILGDLIVTSNTLLGFNQCWFECIMNNIPYILESESIENYTDKFKNKPAIIVSAGPSLDKNIKHLNSLNDNMLIISGGRTLKSLINIDVEPHIMAVIDSGVDSYKLVKDYIDDTKVPLLFYDKTNEDVVSKHKGKKIYTVQSDLVRKIMNKDLKNHVLGGSVAHTMTMAAIELGCNPIIFIGQDLAYTGDMDHADVAKDKLLDENCAAKNSLNLFVESVDGGHVRTDMVLNSFRIELESLIKQYPQYTFINATEGGARIHGTIEMSLEECIKVYAKEYCNFTFNNNLEIEESNKIRALDILNDLKNSIELIDSNCKRGIEIIGKIKVNKVLNKDNDSLFAALDKIDATIKKETIKYNDLNILLYPITYRTMLSSKKEEQNFESIMQNNKRLYEEIIIEFDKIRPVLNSVIEKIK